MANSAIIIILMESEPWTSAEFLSTLFNSWPPLTSEWPRLTSGWLPLTSGWLPLTSEWPPLTSPVHSVTVKFTDVICHSLDESVVVHCAGVSESWHWPSVRLSVCPSSGVVIDSYSWAALPVVLSVNQSLTVWLYCDIISPSPPSHSTSVLSQLRTVTPVPRLTSHSKKTLLLNYIHIKSLPNESTQLTHDAVPPYSHYISLF